MRGSQLTRESKRTHETNLSAVQTAAQTSLRLHGPEQNQGRPRRPPQSPPSWAEEIDASLTRKSGVPLDGKQTLPKTERILASRVFRQLYAEGRRQMGRFVVLYAHQRPDGPRQLGVVTSRRVGGAVVRNRVRRLLRETYRHHKHHLPDHLQLVMIARPAIAGKGLSEVASDVLRTWAAAGLLETP